MIKGWWVQIIVETEAVKMLSWKRTHWLCKAKHMLAIKQLLVTIKAVQFKFPFKSSRNTCIHINYELYSQDFWHHSVLAV